MNARIAGDVVRWLVALTMVLGVLSIGLPVAVAQEGVEATGTVTVPTRSATVVPTEEPTVAPTEPATVLPTETPAIEPTAAPTQPPVTVPVATSPAAPNAPAGRQPATAQVGEEEPTEPDTQLSTIVIYKFVCATIDDTAEEWCGGRVPAAEGTTVDFIVTELPSGYQQTFTVDIAEAGGYTFGALQIIEVPFGAYQVTEVVPDGYDAAAFPWDETQTVDGVTVTIEVGAEPEQTLFVNVPLPVTTPTIAPTSTPTTPTATITPETPGMTPTAPATSVPPTQSVVTPSVVVPPIVPPAVTPPIVPIRSDVTITVLPGTGEGPPNNATAPLIALGLAAAGMALGAVALRRYRRTG